MSIADIASLQRTIIRTFNSCRKQIHRNSYAISHYRGNTENLESSERKPLSTFSVTRGPRSRDNLNKVFVPIPIALNKSPSSGNVGEELGCKLEKANLVKILLTFSKRAEIKQLSAENGLDASLFVQAFISFRKFCIESKTLPVDLHLVFSDIIQDAGHVDDLFPFFIQHARKVFPHLECMDDLKNISDLRDPANWYREARQMNRKIIFHVGPTNSGKTHHALKRFFSAKSGIYCGPLKLLAVEVCDRTNTLGIPCDLVTGEARTFANPDNSPSGHMCCTVEMVSYEKYDVAVIDEIQMIKDNDRGYAWTRALLGICAQEIHLCGEQAAIGIVEDILMSTGEDLQIEKYKRLTSLTTEEKALESLDNVEPGDCVVCFNKKDIYNVSQYLENKNVECAVIYGSLPPSTKLAQAKRFNDPTDSCKVLVATDAIGMGLNLNIRRVIFYSVLKPNTNEKGELEIDLISTSQALQIGGRAGRYGTSFSEGYVTTFKQSDLPTLVNIMSQPVLEICAAGLHPTADQIELFAYQLPQTTLSNLMDIFVKICQVDESSYFMCNVENFKFLAEIIEHIPLDLKVRYVFCTSPINKKAPFACTMFVKFARRYSRAEPISFDWLCNNIGCPFSPPETIADLVHLEEVFDVLDIYLWLGYRFIDMFPDSEQVNDMQHEIDEMIKYGIKNITNLLKKSESASLPDPIEGISPKKKIELKNLADIDSDDEGTQLDIADILTTTTQNVISEESSNEMPVRQIVKGKFTQSLLQDGTLTTAMLGRLYKEWQDSNKKYRIPIRSRNKKS